MRILTLVVMILMIVACNNSAEKNEDTTDTIQPEKQMPEKPAISDTLFTGFGTKPFWFVYPVEKRSFFILQMARLWNWILP